MFLTFNRPAWICIMNNALNHSHVSMRECISIALNISPNVKHLYMIYMNENCLCIITINERGCDLNTRSRTFGTNTFGAQACKQLQCCIKLRSCWSLAGEGKINTQGNVVIRSTGLWKSASVVWMKRKPLLQTACFLFALTETWHIVKTLLWKHFMQTETTQGTLHKNEDCHTSSLKNNQNEKN